MAASGPHFFKGYMFLVLIFCVTLKNSPYISINIFKISIFSTVNKIRPCRLFSLTGQTE